MCVLLSTRVSSFVCIDWSVQLVSFSVNAMGFDEICKTSLAKVSQSKASKTLGISNREYSLLSVMWNESEESILNYCRNLTLW